MEINIIKLKPNFCLLVHTVILYHANILYYVDANANNVNSSYAVLTQNYGTGIAVVIKNSLNFFQMQHRLRKMLY